MIVLATCVLFYLFSGPELVLADPAGPIRWSGVRAHVTDGGWGRMTKLENGNWLCVSTFFPKGSNTYLGIYLSTNQGRLWHPLAQVHEPNRDLDNGELISLSNGTVLLTMRSLILGNSYRLPVYQSTDEGKTWTYLSNIDASEGPGVGGLWEPDFWMLGDGRLAAFYSNESHAGYSQIISEKVSTNNGATWGDEIWAVYQPGGGALRPGMTQICQLATGNYLLVYEIVGIGNADVYCQTSTDGVIWPGNLGRHIPCQHAGPFVASLPDGRLLVTSCENQVSYSDDFGVSWQKTDPPAWNSGFSFDWPAIYVTGSNEVAVLALTNGLGLTFGAVSPPVNWPDLFTDSFDSATDTNWTRYGGHFNLVSGRYWLDDEGTYGKALTGDEFWSDGILQADIMVSTPGNAGLVFRMTNPDYTGPDDGFGYYVGLDTAGAVVLGLQSDSWHFLKSTPMPVPTGSWHHLMVNLRGSAITVYVDDLQTPKLTWNDGTFVRGQIGVRAFQCNAAFDYVTFSNAVPLKLAMQLHGSQVHFAWPQSSHILELYMASNLSAVTTWSPVAGMTTLSNAYWSMWVPRFDVRNAYFRLEGP